MNGPRVTDFEDPIYVALYRYTKALAVALGFRDMYTRIHSDRVLALSGMLGVRSGLSEETMGILRIGAAFHDIGKIGMPDEILLKSSFLDNEEMEMMKKHSEFGEEIILAIEVEGSVEAASIIRHHHEYWNGGGYPDGLAGQDIPISSRIIGIADSYDAMAMTRPYRRNKSHEEIMSVLEDETGQKHDPELMQLFREVIETSELKAGPEPGGPSRP
jgi:HD-GYP domain-containing protein (c-di-GMP phosphodiesterase class II)